MKKRDMMETVYGVAQAKKVSELLMFLDPKLHHMVKTIAYDLFWGFPELPLKEKSIITLCSLMVSHQYEQIEIHIHGFFHLGGTIGELIEMVFSIKENNINIPEEELLKVIHNLVEGMEISSKEKIKKNLTSREIAIIHVASASAAKNKMCLKESILQALSQGMEKLIPPIFIHQAIYCGFPLVMNSFGVFHEVLRDENSKG